MQSTIPYRTLGRTGERVSAVRLGGWYLGLERVDEQLSFRIIRTAIDRGINFLDNCWDYNDGAIEIRMGKALQDGYRRKVFLMTKIDGRSYAEATRQVDQSLERLQTDCIDLVQHRQTHAAGVSETGNRRRRHEGQWGTASFSNRRRCHR